MLKWNPSWPPSKERSNQDGACKRISCLWSAAVLVHCIQRDPVDDHRTCVECPAALTSMQHIRGRRISCAHCGIWRRRNTMWLHCCARLARLARSPRWRQRGGRLEHRGQQLQPITPHCSCPSWTAEIRCSDCSTFSPAATAKLAASNVNARTMRERERVSCVEMSLVGNERAPHRNQERSGSRSELSLYSTSCRPSAAHRKARSPFGFKLLMARPASR